MTSTGPDTAPTAAPVDQHEEWLRLAMVLVHEVNNVIPVDDELRHEATDDRRRTIEKLALTTRARTLPGVIAQLKLVLWYNLLERDFRPADSDDISDDGIRSAIASLEQLSGRA